MGLANSGFAVIQESQPTVAEDAAIFDIGVVHDITDYYVNDVDENIEQYLAQDPGGKVIGVAYASDSLFLAEFSVTGSVSGGPAPSKSIVAKLTYKALAVTEGNECEVGTCWVSASGSIKGTLTIVSCISDPCEGDSTSGLVRMAGQLSGSVKGSSGSISISEVVEFIGATPRNMLVPETFSKDLYPPITAMENAPRICTARIAIDVYPTSVKYNCLLIQSMKYNAIGYVTFDSGINDIVTGSGNFDFQTGSKFTVGNCYGKVTITIKRAVDPCNTCDYSNVATVSGKLAGQNVGAVFAFLVNTEEVDEFDQFLFWPNIVYKPIGLGNAAK
jgi:hypothetical protein